MHWALLHWIWNLVISLRAVSLLWVFWVLFCFAQSLVAWRCHFSTLLSEAGYFLCSWAHLSSLLPWVCNLQSLSSSAIDSTWSWLAKALLFPSLGWICALLFPQKIPGTQILSQKRISLCPPGQSLLLTTTSGSATGGREISSQTISHRAFPLGSSTGLLDQRSL